MWVEVGTNLAQVIGGLRIQLENELDTKLPRYHPRKAGAMPERIYNALVEHGNKIDWPGIVKLCHITPAERMRAAHSLLDLLEYKHVQREGTRRKYKYWATRRA